MFKKAIIAVAAGLLTATSVQADYFDPEDAVKYRQALYQVISAQASVMGGMVRGDLDFDGEEINQRARTIAQTAQLLPETYFPETRGVGNTRMRDRAWNNMEDFQSKGGNFRTALEDLIEASSQSDFDSSKARSAVGALVQSCRSCHDDYRAR
ncbi:Cytochrome c556 [Marinospirillum celere]|uniref:Cytochrome c556 n=1 Tax=Marinospirillum celere TaxID=1122252 RepID=A0A1I1ERI8_9GAMM|nr:cytochrome c [Marinospirillum celere]SFB89296.1 Cytochrome c556 [Marinospirillum celere]